ncbi:MAG: hypothetical protein HYT41_01140 [Candidatus Sungbacteria bacterium]|nr:hypothetical protein [Candidatus Sungbacteria bacterium]
MIWRMKFMRFLKNIAPDWPLRTGLGLMYLYSGYDLIAHPSNWYGFAPQWFLDIVGLVLSQDAYLRLQGAGELIMGLVLLAWFLPRGFVRVVSLLMIAEMMGILLLAGIDLITFRDLGLLGGALTLAILSWRDTAEV